MGVLIVSYVGRHPTDANKVRVIWSEPANAADAATFGNYSIDGGLTVSAAAVVVGSGNLMADLTLSAVPVMATLYTVTVVNVRDIATSTAIVAPNNDGKFLSGTADVRLNGVPEFGGLILRTPRNLVGDRPLGYNVLGDPKDTTAPQISNITPAPGSAIAPNQILGFDVTDNLNAFRRIVVTALYPTGLHEIVHNGDAFTANYSAGSSRSNLAGGFHYNVIRTGGWIVGSNPTFLVYAIDTDGNEAP